MNEQHIQPFHYGHKTLKQDRQIVVVLGSARNNRNPSAREDQTKRYYEPLLEE